MNLYFDFEQWKQDLQKQLVEHLERIPKQPVSAAHELKTADEVYAFIAGIAACSSVVFGRAITAYEAQSCVVGTDGNHAGSYVIVMPSGARVFKCHHAHCAHLNWAWFKEYLDDLPGAALDWTDKKTLILSEDEVGKIQEVATELEKTGVLSDSESENDPKGENDVSELGEPEMDATTAREIPTVPAPPMPPPKSEVVTENNLFPSDEVEATSTAVAETETDAVVATPEEDSGESEETKRGRDYYDTFAQHIQELDELDSTPVCGAQIFQVFYGDKYVYAVFETTGVWMRWTGSIWTPAAAQIKMREAMHRLYRILPKYIAPLFVNNADKQKAVNALAAKFKIPNFVDNVCRVLETETYKMFTDFDHKKQLLNFYNGTLDLNTFTLRPHEPGDLLTKRMSISYNRDAKAPVWEQFLLNCFPNADERKYLQTWAGYCTLGDLTKHLEVEELFDLRPDLLALIAKCIICQRRSDMTGVFVVNAKHAIAYGVKDFKTRSFVYGLCSPCSESPDRPVLLQQIEARFFADAQMPSATVQ